LQAPDDAAPATASERAMTSEETGRSCIGAARNFPENDPNCQWRVGAHPAARFCSFASTAAAKRRTYWAALANENSSDR
jgi:hypothetical protein